MLFESAQKRWSEPTYPAGGGSLSFVGLARCYHGIVVIFDVRRRWLEATEQALVMIPMLLNEHGTTHPLTIEERNSLPYLPCSFLARTHELAINVWKIPVTVA